MRGAVMHGPGDVRVEEREAPQIVEPTCTELGYTAYVCAHCGDRTTGDYVRELGHDWNAGTVVQAPRLTKEGLLEQTCRRCGAEQKTVLRDASVIGRGFWPAAVASICDLERTTIDDILHVLERKEFIRRVGTSSIAAVPKSSRE